MLSENEVLRAAWVLTITQQSSKATLWTFTQVKGSPVLLCSHSNLHYEKSESLWLAGVKQRMGPASLLTQEA